jgi:hypothetical protein
MICLQCQHEIARPQRSQPKAFPGLYTVYKNSRSPTAAHAQCYFVLAP